MEMTIPQARAARALLGWTAADLAEHAQVGAATVRRFESGQTVQAGMVARMAAALVGAGLELYAGGAVIKAERKGGRSKSGPLVISANGENSPLGEQARAAMDEGLAALWEARQRAGPVGKLEITDFCGHWACQQPRALEEALNAARHDAEEPDRSRIDRAIEVISAALLRHV